MERRAEYTTTAPESCEYAAAGLDFVAAKLEICRLRDENATLRYQYALLLAITLCLLAGRRELSN